MLDPVEALIAGAAKETLTRISLYGGVVDHNRWGTGIEDWAGAGAYARIVGGWSRAKRGWPGVNGWPGAESVSVSG